MNRSTNYNFYLPGNSDYRDVNQFNYNFEIIDSELHTHNGKLTTLETPAYYSCTLNTNYIDISQSNVRVYRLGKFGLLTGYFKITTNAPVDAVLITLGGGVAISSRPCYTFVHGYDNAVKGRLEVASGSTQMKVSGSPISAYGSYMYINMPFIATSV